MSNTVTKKILIVSTHFPPRRGGVETSNVQYLETLSKRNDVDTAFLTYAFKTEPAMEDLLKSCKLIKLKLSPYFKRYCWGRRAHSWIIKVDGAS